MTVGRAYSGPLAAREFRLLFLARTISVFGNFVAPVAIAFAVLNLTGSTSDLGLVLAARMVPQVVFLLLGGIWADRLPRHLVMVVSDLVTGAAQAATAVLLFAGSAEICHLIVLQAIGGTAFAFFFPASTGLVPQTVDRSSLQQANALLRMTLNVSTISGAIVGGLVVSAIGSDWALLLDAATFLVSAGFLAAMRISRGQRLEAPNFTRELREGWHEFASRTWLWVIVIAFGFLNAAYVGAINVLGPDVARRELGGATAYGLIVAAQGLGLLLGGVGGLRFRPSRPLFVGCAAVLFTPPTLVLMALAAPLPLIVAAAMLMGAGIETFAIYWDTSLQQHVPQHSLSRVSSYDALGSFVFIPLGQVAIGPVAEAIGVDAALFIAAGIVIVALLGALAVADVRDLRCLEVSPDTVSPDTAP